MLRAIMRVFAVLACCAGYAAAAEKAEGEDVAAPNCVYNSKTFSDGAHICIQRFLLMVCTIENKRPVWKLVPDKELTKYCLTPLSTDD